ncbi:MAG TPA: type II toxin-antitoxin system PemK/MazF family toxin [Candidatus Limnocylindria bacterium]|nr:type II toxin-antitoxin system PemK/MazF family toxin [Candidatus Limnocylindria bacterium]
MAQGVAGTQLRWAVVIVDLDPTEGHEQAGQRRALVVSYEAFHRSGLVTVCPITAARERPRYPGEVAIPAGEGGQTKDGLILCAQVRTISVRRIRASGILPDGGIAYVTDPRIRSAVRAALRHHLGLDIPPLSDGAATR